MLYCDEHLFLAFLLKFLFFSALLHVFSVYFILKIWCSECRNSRFRGSRSKTFLRRPTMVGANFRILGVSSLQFTLMFQRISKWVADEKASGENMGVVSNMNFLILGFL